MNYTNHSNATFVFFYAVKTIFFVFFENKLITLGLHKPLTYFYLDNVYNVFLFLKNFLVYYAKKSAFARRTNIHSLECYKDFKICAKNILYSIHGKNSKVMFPLITSQFHLVTCTIKLISFATMIRFTNMHYILLF